MNQDYHRIAGAIEYLATHFRRQPPLEEIAAQVHLSPFHFQRLFKRWAGITPKRFLQFLTIDFARELLEQPGSLLDASFESGLSGPGRLHDLFITVDAVTPGEYKTGGAGLEISYGYHPCPFGICLLATTARGICHLSFHDDISRQEGERILRQRWSKATLLYRPQHTALRVGQIFPSGRNPRSTRLTLFLQGTNFQLKTWEALLRIPDGSVSCYQDIATSIGHPDAVRAVGNAVGQNPIAFLIPCHRVIRKTGGFGNYRWGVTRKLAMLTWEQGRKEHTENVSFP